MYCNIVKYFGFFYTLFDVTVIFFENCIGNRTFIEVRALSAIDTSSLQGRGAVKRKLLILPLSSHHSSKEAI